MAQNDLRRIDAHYRATDPELALEIGNRIVAAATFLGGLPEAGPVTMRGTRRKWLVPKTRYLLFYRVAPDQVRVLRVLHGAQDVASRQ